MSLNQNKTTVQTLLFECSLKQKFSAITLGEKKKKI